MLCPCFHLRKDSRNTLYTDKMEFHAIELPKLPESESLLNAQPG